MTDQLSFILAPSTSPNLQQSQTLNFLPFSLGPSSNPYASTSAPISTYFQPRSCPPHHSSLKEGTPIAAFRGRQLVGQSVEVPKGYRGVILRAGARPDRGGSTEIRGKAKEGKWPLTPATSIASTSSAATVTTENEDGGVRWSPRKTRGAGQVALSKPRQTLKRGLRKRLRLDSDSEEEEAAAAPVTTPSKRQKTRAQTTPVKPPPLELPEIKIQSPTPRKHLPADDGFGLRRIGGPTGMEEDDPYGGIEVEEVEDVKADLIDESVVPSPATEDQPPLFKVESRQDVLDDSNSADPAEVHKPDNLDRAKPVAMETDEATSSDTDFVRQLRPISTFDNITLWTADVPLVGFRQEELVDRADVTAGDGSTSRPSEKIRDGDAGTTTDTAITETDDRSTDLNPSWWRVGGAGEGGDEFVRGMGEWLGLVHMINHPTYLRDLPKEDEEDDF